MPDAGAKPGNLDAALFGSVLHARARHAPVRARLLVLVPLALAAHALALLGLASMRPGSASPEDSALSDSGELVLRLMAPPPPPPPASNGASSPSSVTRRTLARRALPFPKPSATRPRLTPSQPEPLHAPEPTESTEAEALAAPSIALPAGVAGGVPGGVTGGVVGGLVQTVLSANDTGLVLTPPTRLTPEQRDEWLHQYMKLLIRSRFMDLPYPHQAAAAGIKGNVLLRLTISGRGQLLGLELADRCPHPVLCDAALSAVRAGAPFPAPPPELGRPLVMELPFRFHLH